MIPGLPTHEVGGKTAIEPVLPIVALPHEVSHEKNQHPQMRFFFTGAAFMARCPKYLKEQKGYGLIMWFTNRKKWTVILGWFPILTMIPAFWLWISSCNNWFWDDDVTWTWPYYGGLRFG